MSGSAAPAIASLRERVTLQAQVETDDGAGGVIVTWNDVATVWAAIEPRSMQEAEVSGRLDGIVKHRVLMRHRTDILGGWRIVSASRVLRVLAARDADGRKRFTECLCDEEGR